MSRCASLILIVVFTWSFVLRAEPAVRSRTKSRSKKMVEIDAVGTVIEGDLMRPESTYVVSRKASRFSQLVQERKNFLRELMVSVEEL